MLTKMDSSKLLTSLLINRAGESDKILRHLHFLYFKHQPQHYFNFKYNLSSNFHDTTNIFATIQDSRVNSPERRTFLCFSCQVWSLRQLMTENESYWSLSQTNLCCVLPLTGHSPEPSYYRKNFLSEVVWNLKIF